MERVRVVIIMEFSSDFIIYISDDPNFYFVFLCVNDIFVIFIHEGGVEAADALLVYSYYEYI